MNLNVIAEGTDFRVAPEITCDCEVCASGQPINVQEWRFLNSKHAQIYDNLAAAVERGGITAKGATNG